jgi:hypothetical protein
MDKKETLWPNQMPVVDGVQPTEQNPSKFDDDVTFEGYVETDLEG